jgi:hypothetical protein
MLGLDGFVLLAVSQQNGELEQAVETTAREAFCRGRGVQARLHDRRPTWVRDLPAAGRPFRVSVPIHERSTRPGRGVTAVGRDGHSVAQLAAEFGASWATVMAAVVEYGTPLVDDPGPAGRRRGARCG